MCWLIQIVTIICLFLGLIPNYQRLFAIISRYNIRRHKYLCLFSLLLSILICGYLWWIILNWHILRIFLVSNRDCRRPITLILFRYLMVCFPWASCSICWFNNNVDGIYTCVLNHLLMCCRMMCSDLLIYAYHLLDTCHQIWWILL